MRPASPLRWRAALALFPVLAPATDPVGEWAGWLYLDDGDVPVRLHVTDGVDGLEARIDLPVADQIGVLLGSARIEGTTLEIAHPSASDPDVRFAIDLARGGGPDDPLVGTVGWLGVGGRVELHRAVTDLVWEDPATVADVVGLYARPGEPGLLVRAQPWGELVLVDPLRGDERTLFARAEGRYVVGPALYVPAPVLRELRLERGAGGAVVALVETTDGAERRHPRRPVVREELRVEREGVTLVGTLTIPDGAAPPCAVIAGGSSWTDRSRVESFAWQLAAHGVASVAYDKRGHGESEGESTVPFATTAADLRAFADAARSHPAIDAEGVGYLGTSRGGWYGALAAAEDPGCAFFVDLVGPAVSPIEQETSARLDRMIERGATADELSLGERYLRALWRFARSQEGGDRYLGLRAEVERAGWLGELGGPADLDPDEWTWTRQNGDFDPRPALRRLHCPTLVLYGTADLAVASRINAPLMRDALWVSDAEPCRVLVLPDCDHALQAVVRTSDGERRPFHRSTGGHPDAWRAIGAFLEGLGR